MITGLVLAQTLLPAVPLGAFGAWLVVAACVFGIIYMAVKLVWTVRRQPPIETEFATKDEVRAVGKHSDGRDDKIERRLEGLRVEINKELREANRKQSDRTRGIHDNIEVVLTRVSELKGRFDERGKRAD